MFLLFPSNYFLKKATSKTKKQYISSAKTILLLGTILQVISFNAQADRQECTSVPIPSYDPSGSWDELTGTMTVKVTQTTKYIDVCYTVPDIQTPPIGQGDNGGGGAPQRPKMPRPPYCDTLDKDLLDCQQDKYKAYEASTSSCGGTAAAGGGTTVGGGIGASASNLHPYLRVASGVIAVLGAGAGGWGSTSCYSDPANTKEQGLSQCDYRHRNNSNTCAQFN